MKKLLLLSLLGITMLSHSQTNYLPNVLIIKVKESSRGYFHKDETSNLKLESLYKKKFVKFMSNESAGKQQIN